MSKRFVMRGDTHIIDTKTNEEYYAPCETELLDLLNELHEENKELKQINHSVFKSIGNRIKFWKEIAETNRSNVLQRVVDDLEDLYKLKKGVLNE